MGFGFGDSCKRGGRGTDFLIILAFLTRLEKR